MDIKSILQKHYNLKAKLIAKLDGGFRNQCFQISTQKNQYVFIVYKRERGIEKSIKAAHIIANYLYERGFPVRYPIPITNGEKFLEIKGSAGIQRVALYNFLVGRTIPWEAYTRRHLKSIGKMLSDMHYSLVQIRNSKSPLPPRLRWVSEIRNKFPNSESPDSKNCQLPINEFPNWENVTKKEIRQMRQYFEEVEPWIKRKLKVKLKWNKIDSILKNLVKEAIKFDQGVLHYDFLRGNILFSGKFDKKLDIYPIVGILDFEKVCYGPIIADIARTLAFLLVDCKYKDEETVRKRFLISGYQRRGECNLIIDDNWKIQLEKLLQFFWLRDFWKFLENNPYEYLYMNEHYGRTCNLLVKSEILIRESPKSQRTSIKK